jgi:Flp pilus assembly protein TadD
MKLFFRIILKIFFILTILAGCETTEEIKETDPVALLNQGASFVEKGQYDRAIAYINKAIALNQRDADTYKNRGFTYMVKLGNKNKACSDWKRACELGSCKNYELAKRKGDCK